MDESAAPRPAGEARLLRLVFDRLPALIAYWDRDLLNLAANSAYVEWFGWTPERLLGVHIRDLLGEPLFEANLPFITAALAGGSSCSTAPWWIPEGRSGTARPPTSPTCWTGRSRASSCWSPT